MKLRYCFLLFAFGLTHAQSGFTFSDPGRSRIRIPFTLINNLIIVPVEVNGTKLNFLLDTGVAETILFSLEDQEEVKLNQVEKIRLKGLGSNEPVDGLKSSHNVVSFPGYEDHDHDIYIVLDQSFNFSASIGIPVNGIIGYHFFSQYPVMIDYDADKIIIFRDRDAAARKLSRFARYPLTIDERKPYSEGTVSVGDKTAAGRMLLDTGSADAVWVFKNLTPGLPMPEPHFTDFLGRGLSGEINGERARISGFRFQDYDLPAVLIAFPDSLATRHLNLASGRIGSIGGEVLRRFKVAFDYAHNTFYLRAGGHLADPFTYNMSGMEVQHDGMSWSSERVDLIEKDKGATSEVRLLDPARYSYRFTLRPVFSIASIRPGSPAELCGFEKGDILVSVNSRPCNRMTLQQIREILKSDEGRQVRIEVERKGKPFQCKFRLKSII